MLWVAVCRVLLGRWAWHCLTCAFTPVRAAFMNTALLLLPAVKQTLKSSHEAVGIAQQGHLETTTPEQWNRGTV